MSLIVFSSRVEQEARERYVALSTDEESVPLPLRIEMLRSTIVLGYNVRPDPAARKQADTDGVEIRTYSIIMEMLDDVKAAMENHEAEAVEHEPEVDGH